MLSSALDGDLVEAVIAEGSSLFCGVTLPD